MVTKRVKETSSVVASHNSDYEERYSGQISPAKNLYYDDDGYERNIKIADGNKQKPSEISI